MNTTVKNSRRFCTSVLLITLYSFSTYAEPAYLTVKQTYQNMPSLVRAIAKFGEPTSVTVQKGRNLVQAIKAHCGHLDPTYIALASSRNKISSPVASQERPRKVKLPACILAPTARKVPVIGSTNLSNLAKLKRIRFLPKARDVKGRKFRSAPLFGYKNGNPVATLPGGNGLLRAAETVQMISAAAKNKKDWLQEIKKAAIGFKLHETNKSQKSRQLQIGTKAWQRFTNDYYGAQNAEIIQRVNNLKSLDKISNRKPIWLPGLNPLRSTIRLKPGVNSAVALAAIRTAYSADAQKKAGHNQPSSQQDAADNINAINAPFLIPPKTGYDCRSNTVPWPFDAQAIIDHIERTRTSLQATPGILILDTGFDFYDKMYGAYFPESNRQKLKSLRHPQIAGLSRRTGRRMVSGINVATLGETANSLDGDQYRWHGVGVAGAALGTRAFEKYRQTGKLPIKLAFANIVKMSGDTPVIEIGGLAQAIEHINGTNVKIINASFLIPEVIQGLRATLSTDGSGMILVVAAGNTPETVRSKNYFPAKFGGEFSNSPNQSTVITVGAHDKSGNKTTFSSYDDNRVDLLAPGCDIQSYIGKKPASGPLALDPASWAGTSFSAPIVSFAAGLLAAYGLSPAEIKSRLIVSADVSESLKDYAYSRGRLNILKAISLNYDQIVIQEGQKQVRILSNSLENPLVQICSREERLRDFAKIARDPERGKNAKWHLWINPTPDESIRNIKRKELCDTRENDYLKLKVTDANSGKIYQVTLDNLLDIIPLR